MPQIGKPPARVDLLLVQGDDYEFGFEIKDDEGNPVDLTGATLRAQVRKAPTLPVLFEPTFTSKVGSSSQRVMAVRGVDTAALAVGPTIKDPASKFVWDIELKDTAGDTRTIAEGVISIYREVTKS